MTVMQTLQRCGVFSATLALALLNGCGGGGGGGSATTPPSTPSVPTPSVPASLSLLRLDATNFIGIAGTNDSGTSFWAQSAVTTVLRVAQHSIREVTTLARSGALQMDAGCARYTLIDADGNRVPSAGDTVKIDYNQCTVALLNGSFTGTLTIRLTSVDDAANGAMAGTLDFGAGLVPVGSGLGTWLGTLNFRRTDDIAKEQLDISATAADDLRQTTSGGTEAYLQPRLTQALMRDTARASLTGTLSLSSSDLGGRIDIAPQLSGYLSTYFDTGLMRITGAASSRVTVPASADGTAVVQAELDSDGDGSADSKRAVKWNVDFMGAMLLDQATPSGYPPAPRDDTQLRLINQPPFDHVEVNAPVRFQFDRPLSLDNALTVKLVEQRSTCLDRDVGWLGSALSDTWPEIATDVEFHGAVMLIRPRTPLRYGYTYQVLASNTGKFDDAAVVLHAASGSAQLQVNVQLTSFSTADSLCATVVGGGYQSIAVPGKPITVNATLSSAQALPLRYEWTQLSGPSLVLGSPSTSSTSVSIGPSAVSGVTNARLQLKVTDAIGRTSYSPVDVQVGDLSSVTSVMYFVGGPDNSIARWQTRALTNQAGSFEASTVDGGISVRYDGTGPQGPNTWTLQVSDSSRGVPAPGTYTGTVGYASTDPGPRMAFSGNGNACEGTGSYTVLERVVDSNGVIQRLAIDFDYRCTSGTNLLGPLRGAVRINSTLPVQP